MSSGSFYKQLGTFLEKLEKVQSQRRRARIELAQQQEKLSRDRVLQGLQFSPDIVALLNGLRQHIVAEKSRYTLPSTETPIVRAAAASEASATVAQAYGAPGVSSQPFEDGGEVAAPVPPVAAPATAPAVAPSVFVQEIQLELENLLHRGEHPDLPDGLDLRVRYFANLLLEEIGGMTNETALLGSTGHAIVPRLQQAQQALFANRLLDALTILRSVYKGNAHSHQLLFLLSQFLYLMHALGHQGMLHEARELAQKSIIATDKVPAEKLLRFRFHAIVTELGHEPSRAMSWLRDTALLAPAYLQKPRGWREGGGLYLLAWAVLAEIPVSLWEENEYAQLYELAKNVPGGGLLYLYYFRPPLTAAAATRKDPFPQVAELEKLIWTAWLLYSEISPSLAQMPQLTQTTLWTVRNRFARAVAGVCPAPGFDHILLHIGLDGSSVAGGFPDQHLRHALDDPNIGYWQLWAGCLCPNREKRLSHLLPMAETVDDHELLGLMNELLNHLSAIEQKLIKQSTWNDLVPWMQRWQLDHLLALATGSNRPRTRYAPALAPYSGYYRKWSEPTPMGVLPSEMIAENARHGAFASLFEAQAALEGGVRLITDPVHGLVASQKRALAAARKAQPGKFGKESFEGGGGGALKGLVLLAVLGGGIAAAVQVTENIGQAIGLSLVLAGVVGLLAVQMAKPKAA